MFGSLIETRPGRTRRTGSAALALAAALMLALLLPTATATAQGWDDPPADDRGWDYDTPAGPAPRAASFQRGWSARAGVGFTADPETLLLNFELPYSFDRFVSAGPALQIGLDDDETIVAPTLDVNVRFAEMPVLLDRLTPFASLGIGFAVLDQDERPGDNTDAGFLLNLGAGLEYQVSDHLYLGSQMKFNFLPFRTLGQKFFYSWQVGGVRIAF